MVSNLLLIFGIPINIVTFFMRRIGILFTLTTQNKTLGFISISENGIVASISLSILCQTFVPSLSSPPVALVENRSLPPVASRSRSLHHVASRRRPLHPVAYLCIPSPIFAYRRLPSPAAASCRRSLHSVSLPRPPVSSPFVSLSHAIAGMGDAKGDLSWGSHSLNSRRTTINEISDNVETPTSSFNHEFDPFNPITESFNTTPEVEQQNRTNKKAKRGKASTSTILDDEMLKALQNYNTRVAMSSQIPVPTVPPCASGCSVKECKEKLDSLGWDESDPLREWALVVFVEKESYRECWMTLKEQECAGFIRIMGHRLGLD